MQTCLIGATVLPEILNTLKFRWYCGINFLYRHQWNLEAALLQVCEDRWLLLDLNERFLISSKIMDATIEKKKKILHLRKTAKTQKQSLQKGSLELIYTEAKSLTSPLLFITLVFSVIWLSETHCYEPRSMWINIFLTISSGLLSEEGSHPHLRGWKRKRKMFNWVRAIYPHSEAKNMSEE